MVANHLDEFVRQFRWMLTSRDEFDRLKRLPPDTLTDIQRAARFDYLQRHLAFGGQVTSQSLRRLHLRGPKRINLLRLEEDLSAGARPAACMVWSSSSRRGSAASKRYDSPATLFFLPADPPYWQTRRATAVDSWAWSNTSSWRR